MKNLRAIIVVVGLALILALVNWQIVQKRAVVADGTPLLLKLRPVDPQSLMQGYYMALNVIDEAMPDEATIATLPYSGLAVLAVDAQGVGSFVRLDDGTALQPGELRVRYRRHLVWRRDRLDYGARSFFFEQGEAEHYRAARYAILHVADDGGTVLVDLADEKLQPLTP